MATAALAVAACSSSSSSGSSTGSGSSSSAALTASAPGITATTITIGSHQPLTGPAAPGYSEIAPASAAYFAYVNAHGGVNGRKIVYKYLDDGYNPTTTASVVRQLVLQDNVYAIFDGLGTPTHLAVESFLNAQKVPDVFVASGCDCWNQPATAPETFGWQLDYIREGKILGQYVAKHFAGKKIGYFYQDDEFGMDGVKGLDYEIPKSMVVARQTYVPTNVNIAPAVAALHAAGAQVVVSFSIPAFTALLKLNSLKLGYSPTLVVSNVGSDAITLSGLLESFAKQGGATVNGNQLTAGIITDGYLPTLGDTSNSWTALFKKVHDTYDAKAPFDGNVLLRRGGRVHLRAGDAQGGQEPDQGRPGERDQRGAAAGARGRPVRVLLDRPRRRHRRVHGRHHQRRPDPGGTGPDHGHHRVWRDHDSDSQPAGGASERHSVALISVEHGMTTDERPPAQRLLAAAEELFGERSYTRTAVADICARAGMATGSFYAYYGSKAEIFAAVVRGINADLRNAMKAALEKTDGGQRTRERECFRVYFEMVSKRPWMDRIVRESEFVAPGLFREYYEHLARGYGRGVRAAQLAGEVDTRYDPEVVAYAYTGIGNFIGMRWAEWTAGGQVPEDVLDDVLELLGRGLAPPAGSSPP